MARVPKAVAPECPRCGYDVSGTMSTWTNECPLAGTCSECGYEFQWKHLLGPMLGVPKWFFETARRKKIRAAISTSVRTLAPWKFWTAVRMGTPMSEPRLCVLMITSVLAAYIAGVAASILPSVLDAALHGGFWWSGRSFFQDVHWFVTQELRPAAGWPVRFEDRQFPREAIVSVYCMFVAMAVTPACFLPVGFSLWKRGVRRGHILRASAYVWVGGCVFLCALFACIGVSHSLGASGGRRGYPELVWVGAFLWPIALLVHWCVVFRSYLCLPFPISSAFLVWFFAALVGVIGGIRLVALVAWARGVVW